MNKIPLLRSTTGLKDKLDPTRVPFNADTGATGLTVATDVTIDLTGAISRRSGQVLISAGKCHSGFSCGSYGLCVKDGILYRIDGGALLTPLCTVGESKVAYTLVYDGVDDLIFFISRIMAGLIKNGIYTPWTVPAYVGVESTTHRVIEYLPEIPLGHILHIFNGVMYVAKDNEIYVSELFAYSWFDPKKVYTLRGRITMIRSVTTGIYISDGIEVIFLLGHGPEDFARVSVCNTGVVEGSDINMPDQDTLRFALSGQGICTVDNAGTIINLTETFLNFPKASIGACHITKDKQYILTVV